jgi:hypothetical protein
VKALSSKNMFGSWSWFSMPQLRIGCGVKKFNHDDNLGKASHLSAHHMARTRRRKRSGPGQLLTPFQGEYELRVCILID